MGTGWPSAIAAKYSNRLGNAFQVGFSIYGGNCFLEGCAFNAEGVPESLEHGQQTSLKCAGQTLDISCEFGRLNVSEAIVESCRSAANSNGLIFGFYKP